MEKLRDERANSLPLGQFNAQADEEMRRIWNADPRTSSMSQMRPGSSLRKKARELVKKRWVEQGIWRKRWEWNEMVAGRQWNVEPWKHEEPLELESESETDTEAESPPMPFNCPDTPLKHRRLKSDDKRRQIAERRVIREREREASRPYHQFIYQISNERERIQNESANGEGAGADAADINTSAYENVKNIWRERGIWRASWGILPGMSWRHEEPFEERVVDDPTPILANRPPVRLFGSPSPVASHERGSHPPIGPTSTVASHELGSHSHLGMFEPLFRVASHELGSHPRVNIFGPPSPVASHELGSHPPVGIFGSYSPVASNDLQMSGIIDTPQQEPSATVESTRLANSDAVCSSSPLNISRPRTDQSLWPNREEPLHKDGLQQQAASALFGLVHSSKVSKATGKESPGPQRQPNTSQAVSSGDFQLFSGPGIAESLSLSARIYLPRAPRSEQLQALKSDLPNSIAGSARSGTV